MGGGVEGSAERTTTDRWYKDAVIYAVDVKAFQDSNGDGSGDFRGLIERLDYLDNLGVDCLWLLPFYPTPGRDNGYDVRDYYGVDPRLGTLGDFVDLIRENEERGIRVMARTPGEERPRPRRRSAVALASRSIPRGRSAEDYPGSPLRGESDEGDRER